MEGFLLRPPFTNFIDLLLLSLVVLVSYALAEKYLSRFFDVKFSSRAEKFVFLTGLGLGALAYLTMALGFCGLLYRWLFYCLLLLALLLSGDRINGYINGYLNNIKSWRLPLSTGFEKLLASLLVIFALLALLSALAPPISIDEMMYHLAVPKLYVQHHAIYNVSGMMRSSWIMTQEMLFTLGFLLKGDILAKLFHFLMGVLTAAAVYAFSRNYLSRGASLLASLIFYSVPMVFWLSTVGNNDLGLALFEMLALYGTVNWFLNKGDGWLKLAAVFCGLAMGTKYLGAFSFASIIMLMAGAGLIEKRKHLFKSITFFSAVSFLIASVWYIRNYIYVQNPVFPLLNNIFRSRFWFPQFWTMDLGVFGMGRRFVDYLLLPWNLTIHCRFFSRMGYIGPVFLMALPFLLLALAGKIKVHKAMKYLMAYSAMFFALWALSSQYVRYLIPLLAVLSILTAYAIYSLEPVFRGNIFKCILAAITVVLFLNLPFFTQYWTDSERWGRYCYTISYADYAHVEGQKMFKMARNIVFGKISRDDYLSLNANTGSTYSAVKAINDNLPAGTKVLTIYDFLVCYHDRDVRCDYDYFPELGTCMLDLFAAPEKKYYPGMWSADFLHKLKEMKFTHMLFNFNNLRLARVDLANDKRFIEFAKHHLKPVGYPQSTGLYEVVYD